ncbi:hypothetical protein JW916_03215 [Candidatus Sumerlaeota bacterium]|nr:hypothetical protein [Candidatus Sumerlaeota bacterium]
MKKRARQGYGANNACAALLDLDLPTPRPSSVIRVHPIRGNDSSRPQIHTD